MGESAYDCLLADELGLSPLMNGSSTFSVEWSPRTRPLIDDWRWATSKADGVDRPLDSWPIDEFDREVFDLQNRHKIGCVDCRVVGISGSINPKDS